MKGLILGSSFLDMPMSKALGEPNTEPQNYTAIFEVRSRLYSAASCDINKMFSVVLTLTWTIPITVTSVMFVKFFWLHV